VLTQIVLFYSLTHSDDFKWGKTREAVEETVEDNDENPDLEKGVKLN